MEDTLKTDLILEIEQDIIRNTDLLELAKTYCEFYGDRSDEVSTLFSVLEHVVDMQKKLIKKVDKLLVSQKK